MGLPMKVTFMRCVCFTGAWLKDSSLYVVISLPVFRILLQLVGTILGLQGFRKFGEMYEGGKVSQAVSVVLRRSLSNRSARFT